MSPTVDQAPEIFIGISIPSAAYGAHDEKLVINQLRGAIAELGIDPDMADIFVSYRQLPID